MGHGLSYLLSKLIIFEIYIVGCDPLTNQLANPMVQVNMEGLSSAVPQEA